MNASTANPNILIDQPRIWIISSQPHSGKTSVLDRLLSEHLKLGHRTELVSPNAHYAHYQGIKTWGKEENYNEIAKGIANFTLEINRRIRLYGRTIDYDPLTSEPKYFLAIDELSECARQMPKTIDLTKTFSSLQLDRLLEGMTREERSQYERIPYKILPELANALWHQIQQGNGAIAIATQVTTESPFSKDTQPWRKLFKSSCRIFRYTKAVSGEPVPQPDPRANLYLPNSSKPTPIHFDMDWQAPNPEKDYSGIHP